MSLGYAEKTAGAWGAPIAPGTNAQAPTFTAGARPNEADRRRLRRLGWVTSQGRPLAVHVDHPRAMTRGALVVAPPIGREAVVGMRTTAALALAAASAGFVAFSFSFSGEGDSADLGPDDDLAEAWIADLGAVVAQARAHVGRDLPVHVVGLRVGACVVDSLPLTGPGARVLWEPVSGRSFVRNHAIIRRDSVPVPVDDDGTELEGLWLSDAQVASLSRLRAPRRGPEIVVEADRRAALRMTLGAPYFAHVPLDSIRRIVDGLERGPARNLAAWDGPTTTELTLPDGTGVIETLTTIGGLPVVVTTSPGVTPHVGATFTAMGSEIKAGPGRAWADAARRLAPLGVYSVRADRARLGDDTGPAEVDEPRPYTDENLRDVAVIADHVRSLGLPVVGVGVCAGAWSLLRVAAQGRLDGVVAVNSVHWNPDSGVFDEAFYAYYHADSAPAAPTGPSGPSSSSVPPRAQGFGGLAGRLHLEREWASLERRARRLVAMASKHLAIHHPRVRSFLRPDVPLDLVGMLMRPLHAPLSVHLLFGTEEHDIFAGKGGRRAVAAARRRGLDVTVEHDPVVDHSLFSRAGRERTVQLLVDRLTSGAWS